jgi:colanic acid biosynthesis protein WcaH
MADRLSSLATEAKSLSDKLVDLQRVVAELESLVPSPQDGLPEPVFRLLSRLTPLVSVDLLIKDATGRTLLTWREDDSYGPGWHVPGGIVRYRETVATRIQEVARLELGAQVDFEPTPLSIQEFLRANTRDRAHTVSMLYRCRLLTSLDEDVRFDPAAPKPGGWRWHRACPENLIPEQSAYEGYLGEVF